MTYEINVAGLTRHLPICKLNDDLCIAGFNMMGDPELVCACATSMLSSVPCFDIIVSPEAKAIPLAHEMSVRSDKENYVILRKNKKAYMEDIVEHKYTSITTKGTQTLFVDRSDLDKIKGKRVLIVDDVISTGESLAAVESLVKLSGGNIVGKAAVLAEGYAANRNDIIFLEKLPLFDKDGNPLG